VIYFILFFVQKQFQDFDFVCDGPVNKLSHVSMQPRVEKSDDGIWVNLSDYFFSC